MSAFIIFHSTVTDPDAFAGYAKSVPATLAPFDGTLLTKGKVERVFSGQHEHSNVGIIRFPELDKAHEWYGSEAYQALIPVRDAAAAMTVISYQEPAA
ncbi:MAG: DUF1330 domain-containing protein [Rhodanobacter sp.]|nr:MAG: DUF1330 domain-containing protein [Rhodanobacter sp.]